MPFPPIPMDIPPAVVRTASSFGLDPALLWAIMWRESEGNQALICESSISDSPDVGWCQVNLNTARDIRYAGWRNISLDELLDPTTNVLAACIIFRWRLKLALLTEGIAVSYEDQQRIVNAMLAASRRRIYERAVAGYNKEAAIASWPDVGEVLWGYVEDVMENYDKVVAGGE